MSHPFVDPLSPEKVERGRAWINANAAPMIVLAAGCILLALFTVRAEFGEKPKPPYIAWYYDTVTGEYFEGDPLMLPPIQSPFGNEAVRVFFYGCGDCDPADPPLRMFEKYDANALARFQEAREQRLSDDAADEACDMLDESKLVSFDGVEWFPAGSDDEDPEEKLSRHCTGGELTYILDPR